MTGQDNRSRFQAKDAGRVNADEPWTVKASMGRALNRGLLNSAVKLACKASGYPALGKLFALLEVKDYLGGALDGEYQTEWSNIMFAVSLQRPYCPHGPATACVRLPQPRRHLHASHPFDAGCPSQFPKRPAQLDAFPDPQRRSRVNAEVTAYMAMVQRGLGVHGACGRAGHAREDFWCLLQPKALALTCVHARAHHRRQAAYEEWINLHQRIQGWSEPRHGAAAIERAFGCPHAAAPPPACEDAPDKMEDAPDKVELIAAWTFKRNKRPTYVQVGLAGAWGALPPGHARAVLQARPCKTPSRFGMPYAARRWAASWSG